MVRQRRTEEMRVRDERERRFKEGRVRDSRDRGGELKIGERRRGES